MASAPSFDIVSKVDRQEVDNALNQTQRELAQRLAINLAMYVLCLDYKDDQVHAEELMRRRGRLRR